MARYIDADKLGVGKADRNAFIVPEYADGWNSAIEIISNAPTADVAPKSEVERLEHLRAELSKEIETLKDNNEHPAVLLAEAKSEVAREIFEEIEKILAYNYLGYAQCYQKAVASEIAELKKKYTEEPK